jgi:hypothetical protein
VIRDIDNHRGEHIAVLGHRSSVYLDLGYRIDGVKAQDSPVSPQLRLGNFNGPFKNKIPLG